MPPFRNGLLKRKAGSEESKQNVPAKSSDESEDGSEEELLTGELDAEGDITDSEHEDEAGASDHEQDEVLFDDSADSTFGDDDQADIASEGSSDLRDSEADDESEEDDDDDDDDSDKQESGDDEESVDSGAESGITHTHSGASDSETDEPDKATNQKPSKDTKQKASKDTKQKASKGIKQKASEDTKQKAVNRPKQKAVEEVKQKRASKQDKTKSKSDASIDRLADTIKKASVNIQPVGQKGAEGACG